MVVKFVWPHGVSKFNNFARRIGVSEMTIVNWEKGRTKPTKKNSERLQEILGQNANLLVSG